MRLFGSERIAKLMDRMGLEEGEVIQHSMVSKSIERAQKKVEENNFGIRIENLVYVKKNLKKLIFAKELENIGCECIMPLGSAIGSGIGIINEYNITEIVENAAVPIIVDAGVGTASDACIAMELGCDGVLMNTAIACAKNPILT